MRILAGALTGIMMMHTPLCDVHASNTIKDQVEAQVATRVSKIKAQHKVQIENLNKQLTSARQEARSSRQQLNVVIGERDGLKSTLFSQGQDLQAINDLLSDAPGQNQNVLQAITDNVLNMSSTLGTSVALVDTMQKTQLDLGGDVTHAISELNSKFGNLVSYEEARDALRSNGIQVQDLNLDENLKSKGNNAIKLLYRAIESKSPGIFAKHHFPAHEDQITLFDIINLLAQNKVKISD